MCENMNENIFYNYKFPYNVRSYNGSKIMLHTPPCITFVNSVLDHVIHWEPSQSRSFSSTYNNGSDTIKKIQRSPRHGK